MRWGGHPDGATVDGEGCYWCALFGGGAIARFDPSGRLISTIPLPVKNPTMCAFGGERLDTLFVTSARARMSDEERARQPLAGSLFAITGLGVRGLAETLAQAP